jgi:NADH-ubiquinone oxidoreductase chain 5
MIVAIPYVILAIMSIFFGFVGSDLFVGAGTDFLSTALFIHPDNNILIEGEFALPTLIKNLPVLVSVISAGLAVILYHRYPYVLTYLTDPYANMGLGLAIYKFFNAK